MKYLTLQDLTVAQYQELYIIRKSDESEEDKAVALAAVLTGQTRWDVEKMLLTEFNAVCREIVSIFDHKPKESVVPKELVINGKDYRTTLDMQATTAGQYIDWQTFVKQDNILNMHKLAACLVVSAKTGKYDGENHAKIAEGIQDCKFMAIHGLCVFFLNFWNLTIIHLAPSLKKEMKEKMPLMTDQHFTTLMDGSLMQNEYPLLSASN